MKRRTKSKNYNQLTDHEKLKLYKKHRYNLTVHLLVIVFFSVTGAYILQLFLHASATVYTVPSSIDATCSSPGVPTSADNESGALATWIDSVPNSATVEFPVNGCYNVEYTLEINNLNNVTIDGNGSTLNRLNARAIGDPEIPELELVEDVGLTVTGLNVTGPFNGHNGGDLEEGNNGIRIECNLNTTLENMNVTNVQGDFIDLLQPNLCNDEPNNPNYYLQYAARELDTNITLSGNTFNNAGYDGLVVEAGNGVNFTNNKLSNINGSGTDDEIDDYGTYFANIGPGGDGKGCTQTADNDTVCVAAFEAEDNIHITNNVWDNFGHLFFISPQGQYFMKNPVGVQVENNYITGNVIRGQNGMTIKITGSADDSVPQPQWTQNIYIENNVSDTPAHPLYGGSAGDPNNSSEIQLNNVNNVVITGNIAPVFDNLDNPNYFYDVPYVAALDGWGINGLTMNSNNFTGAYDVLNSDPKKYYNNTNVVSCENTYWKNAKPKTDSSCSIVPPPSTPANFQASAASQTSVNLSWDASSDTDGPGINGYNIFRNNEQITTVDADTTTYTDNLVSAGTSYTYSVQAFDKATPPNVSSPTAPVSVTTPSNSGSSGSTGGGSTTSGGGSGSSSKTITAPVGGKSTPVCLPSNVNQNNVSSVTYSVGDQNLATTHGSTACTTINTSTLSPGTHQLTITVHNKNGTTQTYSEQLTIKKLSWIHRYAFWLILFIILILLGLFDGIWWAIHPTSHFLFRFRLPFKNHKHSKEPTDLLPPPTIIHPTAH